MVSSQLSTFENEVIVSPNDTVTCNAELECTDCNTGRLCKKSARGEWKQYALITCDNTTDKPYCNGGTCSKVLIMHN